MIIVLHLFIHLQPSFDFLWRVGMIKNIIRFRGENIIEIIGNETSGHYQANHGPHRRLFLLNFDIVKDEEERKN